MKKRKSQRPLSNKKQSLTKKDLDYLRKYAEKQIILSADHSSLRQR